MVATGAVHAFTIATLVTPGCHELITSQALRAVRAELATAAPLPASRDDGALIADLPFSPAADMKDLGGASLLVGVRDNDLEGRNGNDLSELALLHGDPLKQAQHCLRSANEIEPDGSTAALAECRAFILEAVDEALDGLDATGTPDPTVRTSLPVFLSLRQRVDASLPTYYVRIGQAIHALEDNLAHGYRTLDDAHVIAVVNWIDLVDNDYHEATDGPPHSTELDRCDDPDDLRRTRRLLATRAATDLLRLTLDPAQSRAQKTAAVSALLDAQLSYSPGCTAQNGWCAAPERAFTTNSLVGCNASASNGAGWGSVAAGGLLLLGARRRRRRALGAAALVAVAFAVALTGRAGDARAQAPPPDPGESPAVSAAHVPPPVTTPVPEPGPRGRSRPAFGGYLGGSGSATDAALAATLGARLRATLHWTFGIDAEWNPWIAINGERQLRAGAFNLYGTVIFRVPLAYERFNLRITANLGGSRTLIALYGVPEGSTGLYAGLSPLGLEWKASRLFYLIINPLSVAAPVPQLRYVPFWYPQYRASIGLEVYVD